MDFIAPSVPGYDVVSLLGSGSSADVWLARHGASGDSVALKRLRTAPALNRERAVREMSVLAGFAHPHVVALRDVVSASEELVLVLSYAGGGSLAAVLARRTMTPGEVVTVAVPIAQALAALHERGVVHGDVSPSNVLFTSTGVPLLADSGVASVLGEGPVAWVQTTEAYADPGVRCGSEPAPAHDVWALAAVCRRALGAEVGAAGLLEPVLAAAMSPDPGDRPTPGELASLMWDACPAEPVRLRPPGAGGRPLWDDVGQRGDDESRTTVSPKRAVPSPVQPLVRPNRRRRRRVTWPTARAGRRMVVVAGALASGLAVAAGVAWASAAESRPTATHEALPAPAARGAEEVPASSPPTAPPRTVPSPTAARQLSTVPAAAVVDWRATLGDLDRRRGDAFAHGDAGELRGLYAAGSPAGERDLAVLAGRRAAHVSITGLRSDIRSVSVQRTGSEQVDALVVDTLRPAHAQVGAGTVTLVPGRGPRAWHVMLRQVGAHWLYWDVTPAPDAQPMGSRR